MAALGFGVLLAVAVLLPDAVRAQSFTWGGTGSTTATSAYSTGTNWSNPPAGAPPIVPGQSAVFGATGSATITIGGGPMLPDSWTFGANSQSYTISGNPVDFSLSGPTGGLINNANAGQTITISANINDAGGGPVMVQQLGNSTLILAGANGYSGGTLISAGTVQVNNANSVGSGTVTLNGGTFQLQSGSVAFSNNFAVNAAGGTVDANGGQLNLAGVIADGAGVLRVTDSGGGGSVQLSGVNTYTGGTLVSGTTLIVSNNSSVGTGLVTLDNSSFQADGLSNLTFTNNFKINTSVIGSAIDSNGTTLTIAGNISGTGKLTILDASFGSGVVVLTGTNTYTGGTVICSCATLVLGDPTHVASITGDVTNEGLFFINNANTSGLTSITTDGGSTVFQNNNTVGSATLITQNGGNTVFLDASSAGNANILNQTGGSLVFGQFAGTETSTAGNATILNTTGGSTFFLANSNAGTTKITNGDGGATFFFDQASAASSKIINDNNGFTQFNSFSTAANATITTNSGGATTFFDNSTGGNAQFITNGTGFVDFGGSFGPNGDGRISAGSIAGSGLYYIGAGNTLVVGSNNLSTNVSGVIADFSCGCLPGPGSLEKVGSGKLTLSGIHNTYTGTTAVNGGFLDVEGSIATSSLLTVNAGGALTGDGIVGKTNINSGGIFLPGNGFGTATQVQGNLAFQSGALYLVQINSTSSTFANVTGTASAERQRRRRHCAGQLRDEEVHDPAGGGRRQRHVHRCLGAGRAGRHRSATTRPMLYLNFDSQLRRKEQSQRQPAERRHRAVRISSMRTAASRRCSPRCRRRG